jgi:hypothetical protein
MILDLSTLTIEDLTGHLWAVDDRTGETMTSADGKMLMTEVDWTTRMWEKRRESPWQGSTEEEGRQAPR